LNDLPEMGLPSGDERLYFGLFHRPKPVPRALAAGLFDDRPQIPDPVSGPGRAFKIKFAHREKISIKLCENAYAMRPMRDRAAFVASLVRVGKEDRFKFESKADESVPQLRLNFAAS
jgi:hypothetical protein